MFKIPRIIALLFFIAVAVSHTSCSGAECAASADFINDIDSDCVDDSSDNCVGFYNPNQFDGDDDGLGQECDLDELLSSSLSEEAIAWMTRPHNLAGHYKAVTEDSLWDQLIIWSDGFHWSLETAHTKGLWANSSLDLEQSIIVGEIHGTDFDCPFEYDMLSAELSIQCHSLEEVMLFEKTQTYLK